MNLIPLLSGFPKNYIYLLNIIPSELVSVVILESNDTVTFATIDQRTDSIYKKSKIHVLFNNFELIKSNNPNIKKQNLNIESLYGFYSLEPNNTNAFSLVCVIKDVISQKFYTIQNNFTDIKSISGSEIISTTFGNYNKPVQIHSKDTTILRDAYSVEENKDIVFSYIMTDEPNSYGSRFIKGQKYAYGSSIQELIQNGNLPENTPTMFPILKQWESPFTISYTTPDMENAKMEFSTGMLLLKYIQEIETSSAQALEEPAFAYTNIAMLNLPPLTNTASDIGIYMGVYGNAAKWRGCRITGDFIDDYMEFSKSNETIAGVVKYSTTFDAYGTPIKLNYLNGGSYYTRDDNNEIVIKFYKPSHLRKELRSCTQEEILNNRTKNLCLIGSELVQFQTVKRQNDKTYRLYNLYRGRKNTEQYINTHVDNEIFILLDYDDNETILRLLPQESEFTIDDINNDYTINTLGLRQITSYNQENNTTFKMKCSGIIPYSPSHGSYTLDNNRNITISWCRRARINYDWSNNTGVPLDESTELYEVDVRLQNSDVVIRTIQSTTQYVTYTTAQQLEDTNYIGLDFVFDIYQISSRGTGIRGRCTSVYFEKGNTLYIKPISTITTISDETTIDKVDSPISTITNSVVTVIRGSLLTVDEYQCNSVSKKLTLNWLNTTENGSYRPLPNVVCDISSQSPTIIRKRVLAPRRVTTSLLSNKLNRFVIRATLKINQYIHNTISTQLQLSQTLECDAYEIGVVSDNLENVIFRKCIRCSKPVSNISSSVCVLTTKLRIRVNNAKSLTKSPKLTLRIGFQSISTPNLYTIGIILPNIKLKAYNKLLIQNSISDNYVNNIEFINTRLFAVINRISSIAQNIPIKAYYKLNNIKYTSRVLSNQLKIRIVKQDLLISNYTITTQTNTFRIVKKNNILFDSVYKIGVNSTTPTPYKRIVPHNSYSLTTSTNIEKFGINYRLKPSTVNRVICLTYLTHLTGTTNISTNSYSIAIIANGYIQTHQAIETVNNSEHSTNSTNITIPDKTSSKTIATVHDCVSNIIFNNISPLTNTYVIDSIDYADTAAIRSAYVNNSSDYTIHHGRMLSNTTSYTWDGRTDAVKIHKMANYATSDMWELSDGDAGGTYANIQNTSSSGWAYNHGGAIFDFKDKPRCFEQLYVDPYGSRPLNVEIRGSNDLSLTTVNDYNTTAWNNDNSTLLHTWTSETGGNISWTMQWENNTSYRLYAFIVKPALNGASVSLGISELIFSERVLDCVKSSINGLNCLRMKIGANQLAGSLSEYLTKTLNQALDLSKADDIIITMAASRAGAYSKLLLYNNDDVLVSTYYIDVAVADTLSKYTFDISNINPTLKSAISKIVLAPSKDNLWHNDISITNISYRTSKNILSISENKISILSKNLYLASTSDVVENVIDRFNYINDVDLKNSFVLSTPTSSVWTEDTSSVPNMSSNTTYSSWSESGNIKTYKQNSFEPNKAYYGFDNSTSQISNAVTLASPAQNKYAEGYGGFVVDFKIYPRIIEYYSINFNTGSSTPSGWELRGSNDEVHDIGASTYGGVVWDDTNSYLIHQVKDNCTYISSGSVTYNSDTHNFTNINRYRFYCIKPHKIYTAQPANYFAHTNLNNIIFKERVCNYKRGTHYAPNDCLNFELGSVYNWQSSDTRKFTKTFSPKINLTNGKKLKFEMNCSRTGQILRVNLYKTTSVLKYWDVTISNANVWSSYELDLTVLTEAQKLDIWKIEFQPWGYNGWATAYSIDNLVWTT